MEGTAMKALAWISLLPMAAAVAAGQANPYVDAPVRMTAAKLTRDGVVIRGRGHVRTKIGPLLLESDDAAARTETGAVEARGHARITLPERSDRNLIRCGAQAVVADEAVVLSADRMDVKHGLLLGRGHVEVRTGATVLQADEIDVYLNIGDAEARGNVRLNGEVPRAPGPRGFRDRRMAFPPEIIR